MSSLRSGFDDDDASIISRNKKIDDMRRQLESKLIAMAGESESEFDRLRKQVADFRTKGTSQKSLNLSTGSSERNSTDGSDHTPSLRQIEVPRDMNSSITKFGSQRNFTTTTTTTPPSNSKRRTKREEPLLNKFNQQDEDETIPVVDKNIIDPYGDSGSYTGELSRATQKPHGMGKMKYKDRRVYEGGWKHGQWHGKGTARFANGDSFKGNYDLDRRHGFGLYHWKDGRSYKGEFYNDHRQGCGEYQWPDRAIYRGEFVRGHRHGEGTYTFADGSTYTGEWSKGRYHGVGQCTWKDGRVYKGEWKEGKAHGYGVEKRANGTIRHDGQWENDNPIRR